MKARGILLVLTVVAVIILAFMFTEPAESAPKSGIIVKLYSGGVQVGEWEACHPCRVENGMYVFTVKEGAQKAEVRINGTFSIEAYD